MKHLRAMTLVLCATAPVTAAPPSFMQAVSAHEAGAFDRCADVMLAVESIAGPMPVNGELLAVECPASAGRHADALAYLRRQLPAGRIAIEDLRSKSHPGLDALRQRAEWPALLAHAEQLAADQASGQDAALREQLLQRAGRDQQLRQAVLGAAGSEVDPARWRELQALDADNAAWLRQVLDEHGWPASPLVGHDGAKAAWLLVQHADGDPALQRRALDMMQPAFERGQVDRGDVALLTDRVLLAEGKPQRYGSQFETDDDGVMRLRPVEDLAGLEARRAAAGLPSMADYRRMLTEIYGQPVE